MPDYRTGGVKDLHYSDTGSTGSWTVVNGELQSAEGLPPELIEQETPNSSYQSGESWQPTFIFTDHQDFDTLHAFAVGNNRAKKFFAIEFYDGTIYKTNRAVYPKVKDNPKVQRGEGDSTWQVGFHLDDDQAMVKIASLT